MAEDLERCTHGFEFRPEWCDDCKMTRLFNELQVAKRALAEERTKVADLQSQLADARFAPMGDNHHNAYACPYCMPALTKERETTRAKVAALTADAERYRWLRIMWWNFGSSNYPLPAKFGGQPFWKHMDAFAAVDTPDKLDAAIDTARAAIATDKVCV